eukprot:jgi/Picre1/30743/NNA_006104.t1
MSRTSKPPGAAAVVWCCLFILASNALLEASATFSSATSNNKIPEKSPTLSPASDEQFEQLRETALGKINSTEMEHAQNHQQLVTEQGKDRDCDTNDIIASISGYTELTLVDPDINPIVTAAFDLVPCGDLVTGSIKLLTSPNMSKKYLGINLSNTKVPVRGVRINGIVLQLGNDGFWSIRSDGRDNIPLQPPYVLQVLGANNELLNLT